MSNDVLSRLLRGQSGYAEDNSEDSIWNLFVQILLPLILILTFLSVMDIMRYKITAEVTEEQNDVLRVALTSVLDDLDPGKLVLNSHRSVLEAQRQKLLRALVEIEAEERKNFKLYRYESSKDVKIIKDGKNKKVKISDPGFKVLCTRIRDDVMDNMLVYRKSVYVRILGKESIRDPSPKIIKRRNKNLELIDSQETLVANMRVISRANRVFIHNQIVAFTNSLIKETVELQTNVLEKLYDALIEEPLGLTDETRGLIKKMIGAEIDNLERTRLVKLVYEEITNEVRSDIKDYDFLDETWRKIASLENG